MTPVNCYTLSITSKAKISATADDHDLASCLGEDFGKLFVTGQTKGVNQ